MFVLSVRGGWAFWIPHALTLVKLGMSFLFVWGGGAAAPRRLRLGLQAGSGPPSCRLPLRAISSPASGVALLCVCAGRARGRAAAGGGGRRAQRVGGRDGRRPSGDAAGRLPGRPPPHADFPKVPRRKKALTWATPSSTSRARHRHALTAPKVCGPQVFPWQRDEFAANGKFRRACAC